MALIHTYGVPAGVAELVVQVAVAGGAIWPPPPHDVALPPQRLLALEAAKMAEVPTDALGLRALIGQDELVAGLAAWPLCFSVVPPAVDAAILVEVDEIHQQLPTRGTGEALRVPTGPMAGPRSKHRHVASNQPPAALLADGGGCGWDGAGAAPTQILPLTLLGEKLQLPTFS